MSISIKSPDQVEKMRTAGKLASSVLEMIGEHVKTGVTTDKLDQICHNFIVNELDSVPAPLNYNGFPKSICTSVNNVVCHGIPSEKKLKKGDIINIDITVIKDGFHGDTSKMFIVGKPSVKALKICNVARDAMMLGIEIVKPGIHLGEIGKVIGTYVHSKKCSVVKDYCGHGIGEVFHELPQVIHYDDGKISQSPILEPGMTFTIEPMVNLGGYEVITSRIDGWTVTTKDRSLSAQTEHTILVTENGYEILTLRDEELNQ